MTSRSADRDLTAVPAISILEVLGGIARRKLMILAITLISLGLGIALVYVLKPSYSTEAQVLIENLATPFDQVQGGAPPSIVGAGVDDRVVTSQMSVLRSEDIGRRVVAALKLQDSPEFNPLIKGLGPVSKLKLMLGFGEDPRRKTPEQRALGTLLDDLAVYQVPQSNVIAIKYSSGNPETAAKIANTLAEIYVMATRENQSAPTARARDWLAQQIDGLRAKLAISEQQVEEFRTKAGLLQGATTTIGSQQISELNTQITLAQAASAEAKAKADAIRQLLAKKGSVDGSSDVQNSPVIQQLKQQRTDAMRRIAELSAVYLPNHPKMVAVTSELANIDRQIRAEMLRIVAGLDEQARIAKAREDSLRAALEDLKTQESTANLDDVKLKALEREAAADRTLLETMMARYAEASAHQDPAAQPGLARIIQTADVPVGPTFPKPGPLTVLVTLAGFSLSLGFAFLIEVMQAAHRITQLATARLAPPLAAPAIDATVVAPPVLKVEQQLQSQPQPQFQPQPQPDIRQPPVAPFMVNPLASLPRVASAGDAAHQLDNPDVIQASRVLSSWASNLHRERQAIRFGVTALGAGQGECALASLALARGAAVTNRVVIVDMAAGDSWLPGLCRIAAGPGILDLVTGAADFTKVIGRDCKSTAHLLRFGLDQSPAALSLLDQRLDNVLGALAQSYDIVLVNAGEALAATPAVLQRCQAAIVLAPAARFADATTAVQDLLAVGLLAARHVVIGSPSAQAASVQPMAAASA